MQPTDTTLPPVPKGFWALMFTQFQGAFSDNALKWLVTFLVFSRGLSEGDTEHYVTLAGAVFAVPFLLFSVLGGWLADRLSKRSVMIGVKVAEIGIMLLATLALHWKSLPMEMACICLMGVHSTFFAPAKYGILPEVLPAARLSWGNGVLEMLTFVAIILGTIAAGWLADAHSGAISGLLLTSLAIVGLVTALRVPAVSAACPGKPLAWNFPAEIWRQTAKLAKNAELWRANWGNTIFFSVSALATMNLALYAKFEYNLKPTEQAWLNAALCLGIGAGSMIAGQLSRGRIRLGFVPVGAILMAAGALALGIPGIEQGFFKAALALLGIGGGLFIVPLAAVLQHHPSAEEKGSVQGVASWWSWVGILAAAALQGALNGAGLTHGQIFWCCGILAILGGVYLGWPRKR